jgi:hypothetical protein
MIARPGVVANVAELIAKNAGRKRCDGPRFNPGLRSFIILAFTPLQGPAHPVKGLMF